MSFHCPGALKPMNPSFENRVFVQHLRGAFDPVILVNLRDQLYSFERFGRVSSVTERERLAQMRGEMPDDIRMQDFWWDVWRQPLSKMNLVNFLSPFTWVIFPLQVRHIVSRRGQVVPWHQDAGFIKLLPPSRQHPKIITVFVPLEDDPAIHTTIEFSLENRESPVELMHEAKDEFGAGLDLDPRDRFHCKLRLGDALVFGDLTLHRTYTPPNCHIERRSLEFRLCMPSDGLRDKDYFDIISGMFVNINKKQRVKLYE
jgi:hypothetical protein